MTRVLGPLTRIGPLVRSLREAGTAVRIVPAGADKGESLDRFGQALRFPDWAGHNYDALFDCLLLFAHEIGGPVHVVWDGTAALRADHPEVFEMVVRVLSDVETERESFSATVIDR